MTLVLLDLEKASVIAFLVGSMGAMGLALTPGAIFAPLRNVRFVLVALALNFLLAPALAWLITVVLPLKSGHTAGLMLLGGAAGAPFLPKLIERARGNLAEAAALMCLLTAGTILFLPFALPVMLSGLSVDPLKIARPLLLLIVTPMVAGIALRSRAPRVAARLSPILGFVGNISLLLLFILLIALNAGALVSVAGSGAILAALIFFSALFVAGWITGGRQRASLSLAASARNFGAALAPAENCFNDPDVTVMIVVGAIVCLVVSFAAAAWVRQTESGISIA